MKTFRLLRLDHIVIDTGNLSQALKFYAGLPGCETSVETGRGIAAIGKQKINIHEYPPTLSPVAKNPVIGRQSFRLVWSGTPERSKGEFWPQAGCAERFFVLDPDGNRIEAGLDPDSPQPRIEGLDLLTADLGASVRFYTEILGMEAIQAENGVLCMLETGHLRLLPKAPSLVRGAADFCIVTDADIAAVHRAFAAAPLVPGLGIVRRTGALGPLRSLYLRDPDGNLVEIAEYMEKNLAS